MVVAIAFAIILCSVVTLCAAVTRYRKRTNEIGFLHPSSGGGGGGERVLWVAIRALQNSKACPKIVLFTRSYGGSTEEEKKQILLRRIMEQFSVEIGHSLRIVFMSDRNVGWLEPAQYPRFTLIRQTFWSGVYMFLELGVLNTPPAVLVETVGIPFVYPLVGVLSGVTVIPYTHYPVISTDMLKRVASGTSSFNNCETIGKSAILTKAKQGYYHAFSWFYWFCGYFATDPIANSSWTADHVSYMWGKNPRVIFPPCNVENLLLGNVCSTSRKPIVVSVGQFRPEKNHHLQLEIFKSALPRLPHGTKLILAGGARSDEDLARVESLKEAAAKMGLHVGSQVEFRVSRPYDEIRELLFEASVGLHTMTDEHFGIVVAEYQAAGALALANNSAGPKRDIITSKKSGRLASSCTEYADALVELFEMSEQEKEEMRVSAKREAGRFTDAGFAEAFTLHILRHFRTL